MAAQSGIARFIGMSGRTYNKGFYLDDSAGHAANWDAGAGAGTSSPTTIQFNEPVALVDVAIAAATGQTQTRMTKDGVPTGDSILNSLHVATVTTRPSLAMPIGPRQLFAMWQVA